MTELICAVYLIGVAVLAGLWAMEIEKARQDREAWYRDMHKRLDRLGAEK